ncbi:hypothetical protein GCM10008901_04420 [Bifidobacterium pullorum]
MLHMFRHNRHRNRIPRAAAGLPHSGPWLSPSTSHKRDAGSGRPVPPQVGVRTRAAIRRIATADMNNG